MLLEKRVGVLSEALEMKDAQLGEVLAAAHLDPATLQQVRTSAWQDRPNLTCAALVRVHVVCFCQNYSGQGVSTAV
jgi:hypothetical protein